MWDLIRFVLICIFQYVLFFNIFYKYKLRDICPQSFALTCMKSESVTSTKTEEVYINMSQGGKVSEKEGERMRMTLKIEMKRG